MNKKFFSPFIQRLTIYQHLINKQKRYKEAKNHRKTTLSTNQQFI